MQDLAFEAGYIMGILLCISFTFAVIAVLAYFAVKTLIKVRKALKRDEKRDELNN